jgi:hypothetical protein
MYNIGFTITGSTNNTLNPNLWFVRNNNDYNASDVFKNLTNMSSFTGNILYINNASNMFYNSGVIALSSNLWYLFNGSNMFAYSKLASIVVATMPNLFNGSNMFYNSNLQGTITMSMSSLYEGNHMFSGTKLVNFSVPSLNSMVNAVNMFCNCTNLVNFTTNLS